MTNDEAVISVLSQAKTLLETKGWTQKTYARNKYLIPTSKFSPAATSFCTIGAIDKCAGKFELIANQALNEIKETLEVFSISSWNDSPKTSKKDVIAAIEKTIDRLKKANSL